MKGYRAKRVMYFVVLMAMTGALVLVLTASIQAQQRSAVDVFNAARNRENEERERRRALEHIGDEIRRPSVSDQRQRLALITQIKQDFNLIQVLNNEMIRVAFTDQALDYEILSEKAADIKKRATRLRASIKFFETKDEKKNQKNQDAGDNEQLKASLIRLRHLISSFVNSPLFQNPGVIDVQLSAKASRDLRDIIELSDSIRKNAKRLDKASKQLRSAHQNSPPAIQIQ